MKDQQETTVVQKKPTKLRNLIHKTEAFDSLNPRGTEVCIFLFNTYLLIFINVNKFFIFFFKYIQKTQCSSQVCLGSIMTLPFHGPEPRKKEELLIHAKDFLEQYFTSIRR